jgi:hypothetical protein
MDIYSQWGLLPALSFLYRVKQEVKRQAKQLDAVLCHSLPTMVLLRKALIRAAKPP